MLADGVEGSEIRAAGCGGGGSEGSGSRYAHTRSDALSGFDLSSESEEGSSIEEGPPAQQMRCRVTERGVEWEGGDLPTEGGGSLVCKLTPALLREHESKFPRWMEVKMVPKG
uniref:Uncharacterized protein n=1 Tax=Coccolithus braarudii TaxID=221442 RepID=A0A7S0LFY4_9EUKA